MRWSDGLFSHPPNTDTVYRAINLLWASYTAAYDSEDNPPTEVVKISDIVTPGVYSMLIDGERVVCISGTPYYLTYLSQAIGWDHPIPFPGGGKQNAAYPYYVNPIAASCPADTSLVMGHSMGGALASLVAKKLRDEGNSIVRSFAAGSPKPVTSDAYLSGSWPRAVHVINPDDPIPHVPVSFLAADPWVFPAEEFTLTAGGVLSPSVAVPGYWIWPQAFAYLKNVYWHTPGAYVQLFMVVPSPITIPGGGTQMAAIGQFTVNGRLLGKRPMNVTHYYLTGNFPAAEYASKLQAMWRANILPLLAGAYTINSYEMAIISGVAVIDPAAIPPTVGFRFGDTAAINGTAGVDKGTSGNTSPMASFCAFGLEKVCDAYQTIVSGTLSGIPAGLPKRPRGGMRIAGPIEADTDGDTNRVIAGKYNQLVAAVPFIRQQSWTPAGGGGVASYQMCVVTMHQDGAPIPQGAGWGYYAALVNSLRVNPNITSQVSRKASSDE